MYSYAPYPSGSPRSFDRFMDIVFFNKLYGTYLEGTWPLPLSAPHSIFNPTSSPSVPPSQHVSEETASVTGTPAQTFNNSQDVPALRLGPSPVCRSCDDSSDPVKEPVDPQIDCGAINAAAPPGSWHLSNVRQEGSSFTDTSEWRRIATMPLLRQDTLYSTSGSPVVGYGPMSPQLFDVERNLKGTNIDPSNIAVRFEEGGDVAPSPTSGSSASLPRPAVPTRDDGKGFEKPPDFTNGFLSDPDCFIRLGVHPDASSSQLAAAYVVQRLVTELQDPDSDRVRMLELVSDLAELKKAFHGAHLVRLLTTNLQLRTGGASANAGVVQPGYEGLDHRSASERASPNTGYETPKARMPLSPCCVPAPRWK